MKTRKIKSIEHPLFQDSLEFSQYMPNTPLVADWRLGLEGDWVSTEDGQVCQILKRGSLKDLQLLYKNYNGFIRL